MAAIPPGQEADATVDTFPGRVFRGKVQTVDARVDQNTRNVLIRATFDNKDHSLRPGMFANVGVVAGKPVTVVTLPRTAVTFSLYGDAVYVVVPVEPKSGGAQARPLVSDVFYKVERRFVRTGDSRGDRIAITSGVKAGELVVSEGQLKLKSGAPVHINRKAGLVPRTISSNSNPSQTSPRMSIGCSNAPSNCRSNAKRSRSTFACLAISIRRLTAGARSRCAGNDSQGRAHAPDAFPCHDAQRAGYPSRRRATIMAT